MTTFLDKLQAAQTTNNSWMCIGLDPLVAKMPAPMAKYDDPFLPFLKSVVDVTSDLVCAYKPNMGFFLALGAGGVIALERIIAYVPDEIPVILDAKLNDIGHTAQAYAQGAFEALGVDGVTVNPYLGKDGVAPFLSYPEKAAFVLARTSNKSAGDFQDLYISRSSEPVADDAWSAQSAKGPEAELLFEKVVQRAMTWNREAPGTCGLVVGATYPQELAHVRTLAPELPFLIPGIGAQGGDLEAAVRYGQTAQGIGPIISSSRGVLYASARDDYTDAARRAAEELRGRINATRQSMSEA
jgi:orotidine-5'-phosphate decarboxylase